MTRLFRPALSLAASLALAGCAGSHPGPDRAHVAPPVSEPEYEAVTASALVFDPPVIANEPPLELGRSGRDSAAFVGYVEGVAEFFYLRVDDRQTEDFRFDRYERRAVSQKTGVLYR